MVHSRSKDDEHEVHHGAPEATGTAFEDPLRGWAAARYVGLRGMALGLVHEVAGAVAAVVVAATPFRPGAADATRHPCTNPVFRPADHPPIRIIGLSRGSRRGGCRHGRQRHKNAAARVSHAHPSDRCTETKYWGKGITDSIRGKPHRWRSCANGAGPIVRRSFCGGTVIQNHGSGKERRSGPKGRGASVGRLRGSSPLGC
jgi:hypothetical protein